MSWLKVFAALGTMACALVLHSVFGLNGECALGLCQEVVPLILPS